MEMIILFGLFVYTSLEVSPGLKSGWTMGRVKWADECGKGPAIPIRGGVSRGKNCRQFQHVSRRPQCRKAASFSVCRMPSDKSGGGHVLPMATSYAYASLCIIYNITL